MIMKRKHTQVAKLNKMMCMVQIIYTHYTTITLDVYVA